jgi:hypothetical protein
MAEWWHNTSYHTSLKSTLFEVVYGYTPPWIIKYIPRIIDNKAMDTYLRDIRNNTNTQGKSTQGTSKTEASSG